MKRALILIMAIIICLVVTGCADKVSETEELIEAVRSLCDLTENTQFVGNVAYDMEDKLELAENAYNSLSEEDKAKVSNADILVEAREAFDKSWGAYKRNTINSIDGLTSEEKDTLNTLADLY